MTFEVSAELEYTAFEPCTLVLNLHALNEAQTITRETFLINPFQQFDEVRSPDGNRLVRVTIDQPGPVKFSYNAEAQNAFDLIDREVQDPTPVSQLPPAIFSYLHPSRYCQSDKLFRFAEHQFGKIDNEFQKVLAITGWIHSNVEYLSGSTNGETSAYDTVTQQAGVCRDFAHLGIALCRALTIPARYCSVYAYQLQPQDFHACFEAYLSGRWIIFDATRLAPLNGLVRIAVGRDAADTAIADLFGNITHNFMQVSIQLKDEHFQPMFYDHANCQPISYR